MRDYQQHAGQRHGQDQIQQMRWVEQGRIHIGEKWAAKRDMRVPQGKPAMVQRRRQVFLVQDMDADPVNRPEHVGLGEIARNHQGGGGQPWMFF